MRTNIVIDDELMSQVLKLTGLRTKREAVELALKALLKLTQQEGIRAYRGKLDWEGDLDDMRTDKRSSSIRAYGLTTSRGTRPQVPRRSTHCLD